MIDRELKVDDYIFNARGGLARITKVNKSTYSYQPLFGHRGYYEKCVISFNGIGQAEDEWFYCDNPTAMALQSAFNVWKRDCDLRQEYNEIRDMWDTAGFCLKRIKELNLDYLKPGDYDDCRDNYDYEDIWYDMRGVGDEDDD